MLDTEQELFAKALLDNFTTSEIVNQLMDLKGGGSQEGGPDAEKVTDEKKEAIRRMISVALFIDYGQDEAGAGWAPVMIVQHSPYNIYALIKAYLRPEYVHGVERFWSLVRQDGTLPRKTWRPRLQSAQIKSLQNTRYPKTQEEWNRVEEMALNLAPYFKEDLTHHDFYEDIKAFVTGFETLWATERKHTLAQSRKKRAKIAEESDDEDPRELEDYEPEIEKLNRNPRKNAVADGFVPPRHDAFAGSGDAEDIAIQEAPAYPSLVRPPLPYPGASRIFAFLKVGGEEFTTTLATLLSVPDSFFSKLVGNVSIPQVHEDFREFVIDRSPEMFSHILEYLRARRYGEVSRLSFPAGERDLKQLLREAIFYELREFAASIEQNLNRILIPKIDFVVVTSEAVEQGRFDQAVLGMTQRCNELVAEKICLAEGALAVIDQKLNTFVTQYGETRVQIVVSLRSR